eukprot:gnl/TRDRNA2_/TRDRNA2_81459_c0_seq1.p1 gnl/TRDRNA2_/TRDRNA2_81459_c0~~gnl/TRDRNA2_/TRDRNA2_81459_c0_seq1.p1  ORF type:complete len:602 (+),score=119.52 gnl/TRDRNA2_/TRDRNA2_81459_c0_seq1:197-2002(+)
MSNRHGEAQTDALRFYVSELRVELDTLQTETEAHIVGDERASSSSVTNGGISWNCVGRQVYGSAGCGGACLRPGHTRNILDNTMTPVKSLTLQSSSCSTPLVYNVGTPDSNSDDAAQQPDGADGECTLEEMYNFSRFMSPQHDVPRSAPTPTRSSSRTISTLKTADSCEEASTAALAKEMLGHTYSVSTASPAEVLEESSRGGTAAPAEALGQSHRVSTAAPPAMLAQSFRASTAASADEVPGHSSRLSTAASAKMLGQSSRITTAASADEVPGYSSPFSAAAPAGQVIGHSSAEEQLGQSSRASTEGVLTDPSRQSTADALRHESAHAPSSGPEPGPEKLPCTKPKRTPLSIAPDDPVEYIEFQRRRLEALHAEIEARELRSDVDEEVNVQRLAAASRCRDKQRIQAQQIRAKLSLTSLEAAKLTKRAEQLRGELTEKERELQDALDKKEAVHRTKLRRQLQPNMQQPQEAPSGPGDRLLELSSRTEELTGSLRAAREGQWRAEAELKAATACLEQERSLRLSYEKELAEMERQRTPELVLIMQRLTELDMQLAEACARTRESEQRCSRWATRGKMPETELHKALASRGRAKQRWAHLEV